MVTELLERDWLTLHSALVVLGLGIYVVGSRTLRQRRRPSAAIAWVIALLLLPYVALPLYMVFGTRKIVDPRQAAGGQAHPALVAGDPESAEVHLRKLAAAMSLPGAASYRQLNIHQDGVQALAALR
jgi:cardiolipin synthase